MPNSLNHIQADLDAEELFHLGLRASTDNDSANALGFLRAALQKDPGHAKASWLLGAEYAQLGMMDRAREAMSHALVLDPSLAGARFQYGLLLLTSGEIQPAAETWGPLDELPADNPYRMFKNGLLHMVRDEFADALQLIRQALTLPNTDAALRKDMEMIIGQIEATQSTNAGNGNPPTEPASDEDKTQQDQLQFTAYRTPPRH